MQSCQNDRKVEFRIGINLGDVIEDRGDVYGDGVNVAARLEGLAEPGTFCISEAIRSAVGKKLPLKYNSLGEQRVKDISQAVRAYQVLSPVGNASDSGWLPTWTTPKRIAYVTIVIAVATVAVGLYWLVARNNLDVPRSAKSPAFQAASVPSIVVLPFTNLSDDEEQEFFADGMTDDLITDLSKLSGLFVIARNSAFTYKDEQISPQEVAENLGVRYILEGSVRRAGDTLRINAQLTDSTTTGHIWADRYDGSNGAISQHILEFRVRVVDTLGPRATEPSAYPIGPRRLGDALPRVVPPGKSV
jgi:TolB-like protein